MKCSSASGCRRRNRKRFRAYPIRPLAALAVPCRTVVLPAVLPPCHRPNGTDGMDASPRQRALQKGVFKKGPSLRRHRCAKVEIRTNHLNRRA